jgi:hypothetical protein
MTAELVALFLIWRSDVDSLTVRRIPADSVAGPILQFRFPKKNEGQAPMEKSMQTGAIIPFLCSGLYTAKDHRVML